jgi:hypothetical protein
MTPVAVYEGLRRQIIELGPDEVGLEPSAELPTVWGLVMDLGFPGDSGSAGGTATLVALADGSTSLYLSNGGGIIGGGARPRVAAATLRLLGVLERQLDLMSAGMPAGMPAAGRVVLRALAYAGPRSVEADEEDLEYHRHPLSDVFHAAHEVITELRLVEQARQR